MPGYTNEQALEIRLKKGNEFVLAYKKAVSDLLTSLQVQNGHIEQEAFLEKFSTLSHKVSNDLKKASLDGGITFLPSFKGDFYGMIDGLDEPVSVQLKSQDSTVKNVELNPRLLLWNEVSPIHTHIIPDDKLKAGNKLKVGEVLCAYFLTSGKASEVLFSLSRENAGLNATVNEVRTLEPGLNVDRYKGNDASYTHQFLPNSESLQGIYFLDPKDQTKEIAVRSITSNIYNGTKPATPAYGERAADTNATLTSQALNELQEIPRYQQRVQQNLSSEREGGTNLQATLGIKGFSVEGIRVKNQVNSVAFVPRIKTILDKVEVKKNKILFIGAGASTTIALENLTKILSESPILGRNLEVTIVEKSENLGRGVAYSTKDQSHRLNAPASRIGVDINNANGFLNWLRDPNNKWKVKFLDFAKEFDSNDEAQKAAQEKLQNTTNISAIAEEVAQTSNRAINDFAFVPRALYGDYLEEQFKLKIEYLKAQGVKVNLVKGEAIGAVENQSSGEIKVKLNDSGEEKSFTADKIVIAIGNPPPANSKKFKDHVNYHPSLWSNNKEGRDVSAIPHDAKVVIVGTGLSAVDALLTLQNSGHTGDIKLISRNGKLPLVQPLLPQLPYKREIFTAEYVSKLEKKLVKPTADLYWNLFTHLYWNLFTQEINAAANSRFQASFDNLPEEDKTSILREIFTAEYVSKLEKKLVKPTAYLYWNLFTKEINAAANSRFQASFDNLPEKHKTSIRIAVIESGRESSDTPSGFKTLWRKLPFGERREFVRKYDAEYKSWRFRQPTQSWESISPLFESGKAQIVQGDIKDIEIDPNTHYINCTEPNLKEHKLLGILTKSSPDAEGEELFNNKDRIAEWHKGGGGLHANAKTQAIIRSGEESDVFSVVGNLKGRDYETVAIKEIREQVEKITDSLKGWLKENIRLKEETRPREFPEYRIQGKFTSRLVASFSLGNARLI